MKKKLKFNPAQIVQNYPNNLLDNVKVTFINMPLRETALPNTPPEGPAILSSIIRKYGGEPHILDLNGYRIKDEIAHKKGLINGRHLTCQEAENLIIKHLKNILRL